MIARENVINGLQCIIDGNVRCESCGYSIDKHGHHSCQQNCASDAIAILKEQEAHVLTLDEAVDGNHVYYVEFQYHLDRGWVKCDFDKIYVNGEVAMLFLRDKTFYQQKEHYGQLWRLWSNRPTYEQMKAVKWE